MVCNGCGNNFNRQPYTASGMYKGWCQSCASKPKPQNKAPEPVKPESSLKERKPRRVFGAE
jgi:hypothetical protein